MKQNYRYPLVRLPETTDLVLFLICEELKSRKLAHGLHQAGFECSNFQPHLDSAILVSIGFEEDNDAAFEFYDAVVEETARQIDEDRDVITQHALNIYHRLTAYIKERAKPRNP